jgi:hypothetical protein
MKPIRQTLLITSTLVMLAGCGSSDPSGNGNSVNVAPADVNPCDILGDKVLHAHFSIADGTVIERSKSKHSMHPLCTASWKKPNAAELEKKSSEAMMEYIRKKSRGEDVKIPITRTTNEVTLTLNKSLFENASAAQAALDSSMKVLSEGITRKHNGVEVTFQADVIPVEGVGDKAAWAAKLRQLSVADGKRVFHLTVNTGGDREQELIKAKELAQDLVKSL